MDELFPTIRVRVLVFGEDVAKIVADAGPAVIEFVRLLTDVLDVSHRHGSTLQLPAGPGSAWRAIRSKALVLAVRDVLRDDVAVALDTCDANPSCHVVRRDLVPPAAVAVGPRQPEPLRSVLVKRCDELEAFGVDADWIAEWPNVRRENEVEWSDRLVVAPAAIEI